MNKPSEQKLREALLPCPFCGGKAHIVKNSFPLRSRWRHPSCEKEDCPGFIEEQDEQGGTNCDCQTDETAIELWNRRAALTASEPQQAGTLSGADRIAAERKRQIEVEGWTAEHDAQHSEYALQAAARCYAAIGLYYRQNQWPVPSEWPWKRRWWKPSTDEIKNLVRAGALIAAAIDRALVQPAPAKVYVSHCAHAAANEPSLNLSRRSTMPKRKAKCKRCKGTGEVLITDKEGRWMIVPCPKDCYTKRRKERGDG